MSDVFPKFIIEDDCLYLGNCTYHKQLATNKDKVKGGGWFRYNSETDTFTLHGSSEDFGAAKIEDIQKCINEQKVFSHKNGIRNLSSASFNYDTQSEIIKLK